MTVEAWAGAATTAREAIIKPAEETIDRALENMWISLSFLPSQILFESQGS
jgi:hypothetical protein